MSMDLRQEHEQNQATFRRLKPSLDLTYPAGRFLAVSGDAVIADAGEFAELRARLVSLGRDPSRVLVVQAGADYPEHAAIFPVVARRRGDSL